MQKYPGLHSDENLHVAVPASLQYPPLQGEQNGKAVPGASCTVLLESVPRSVPAGQGRQGSVSFSLSKKKKPALVLRKYPDGQVSKHMDAPGLEKLPLGHAEHCAAPPLE